MFRGDHRYVRSNTGRKSKVLGRKCRTLYGGLVGTGRSALDSGVNLYPTPSRLVTGRDPGPSVRYLLRREEVYLFTTGRLLSEQKFKRSSE